MKFSFLNYSFDEEGWIKALSIGKYQHPVYGEIVITPERIQKFATNINKNVRGQMLDIDYDHKAREGKAAGWITKAEARVDGLWVLPQWTPAAQQALKDGEYRYFSPEFTDEWVDNQGNKHEDVLFGGALTNRPFLKDLLPVNLSEMIDDKFSDNNGREEETPRMNELLKLLGLSENADETAILNAVKAQLGSKDETISKLEKTLNELGGEEKIKQMSEFYTKHMEEADKQKKFEEMFPEQAKALRELTLANKLSEVNVIADNWTKLGMPPVVVSDLKALRMELNGDYAAKFDEAIQKLAKTGTVKYGEVGSSSNDDDDSLDLEVRFMNEVEKLRSEKNLDFRGAIAKLSETNPDLVSDYYARVPRLSSDPSVSDR